jgi:peptide-methionine (S)-S-oxide reductase
MRWRFLTAGIVVSAVCGFSSGLRADDGKPSGKGSDTAENAGTAKSASTVNTDGTANSSADGSPGQSPSTSSASKAKSKKTSSRLKNRVSSQTTASPSDAHIERATFGAGCFWHVEDTFERLPGVLAAVSGYAGGNVPNPSYEMVHEGFTGHAEVVMVEYDADKISYEDLLHVFWTHHDPTTPNRQGPDVGPQYRSIILYHNEAQRKAALKSYQDLVDRRAFRYPIVTQLVPLKRFYRAEDYHQDYYGGKPRTTSRRRTTTAAKAKTAQAKKAASQSKPKTAAASPAEKSAEEPPAPGS